MTPNYTRDDGEDEWTLDGSIFIDSVHEDDFVIYSSEMAPKPKPMEQVPIPTPSDTESELLSSLLQYHWYLSCPETSEKINAGFLSAASSPSAALELRQYYLSRPQLFQYTFNTELHRMKYTVKDGRKKTTDVKKIRSRYQKREELLIWRAANQSLLADAIQCLTGPDSFIRPQYLAMALADHCDFEVDLKRHVVHCTCRLLLSLPLEHHYSRLEIATLQLSTRFYFGDDSHPPTLQIETVDLTPKPVKGDKFLSVAQSLARDVEQQQQQQHSSLPIEEENIHIMDSFRDRLVTSVAAAQNITSTGMTCALRQMETVANVGNKLKFLKGLIPTAELLEAVSSLEGERTQQHRPSPLVSGVMQSLTKLSTAAQSESDEIRFYYRDEDIASERQKRLFESTYTETKIMESRNIVENQDSSIGWSDDDSQFSEIDDDDSDRDRAQIVSFAACTKEHQQVLIVEEEDDTSPIKKRWRRPLLVRL